MYKESRLPDAQDYSVPPLQPQESAKQGSRSAVTHKEWDEEKKTGTETEARSLANSRLTQNYKKTD